jgi:hypothetical protein
VLNAFSYLLKKNCVPKESLEPLFDMTLGRIKDTSGWVRKASIQTIKQIIKYLPTTIQTFSTPVRHQPGPRAILLDRSYPETVSAQRS